MLSARQAAAPYQPGVFEAVFICTDLLQFSPCPGAHLPSHQPKVGALAR